MDNTLWWRVLFFMKGQLPSCYPNIILHIQILPSLDIVDGDIDQDTTLPPLLLQVMNLDNLEKSCYLSQRSFYRRSIQSAKIYQRGLANDRLSERSKGRTGIELQREISAANLLVIQFRFPLQRASLCRRLPGACRGRYLPSAKVAI